ncbi:efflux RND transporter periplasmic adaptor subunit [Thermodesulfobacteriota bacterium B35]
MTYRLFAVVIALLFLPLPLHADSTCTALPSESLIRLTGFTRARASMDIVSEVSGRCLEVRADVGQPVPADGVFARIDPTFIRLELEANAIARRQARRQLRYEEREVRRARKLLTDRASSQARLDQLELKRDQTRLKLDQLASKRRRLEETLARHAVPAPAGWLVIRRNLEPGQWVTAGTPLARCGDYTGLIVPLAVTAPELARLREEKPIRLEFPDQGLPGTATLYRISPGFDPATRKVRLDLLVDRETLARLPRQQGGLRVVVRLTMEDPMHALRVPAAAVRERYEENWLTRPDGSQVRIIVLGPAPPPAGDKGRWLRIISPEISAGDIFLLPTPGHPR